MSNETTLNQQAYQQLAGTLAGTGDVGYLASQLMAVENAVYEAPSTPMQYASLIPISSEAGEGATAVRYEMYQTTGMGKKTSGRGKDINRTDLAYTECTVPVYLGNIGYDFTQEELRQSAYFKRPLPTLRAKGAFLAYERHINHVAFWGEDELTGLYNNAFVAVVSAVNGAWATASAEAILEDINQAIQQVWEASDYVEMPNTILIPPTVMGKLATTQHSQASDLSILEYLRAHNLAKAERGIALDIMSGLGLEKAGSEGSGRLLVYTKHPEKLCLHLPMPLRFLAPQMVGLTVEMIGEYKYSGVHFRYPQSACYVDGI